MSELPPNLPPAPPPDQSLTYAQPVKGNAGLGLGISSLVLGLLSIPLDYAFFVGMLTALIGLILGIAAARRGSGAGRILGILGITFSTLAILVGIGCGIFLFTVLRGD